MTANPATVLNVPRPEWARDDVAMLQDMATRFLTEEILPRYEEFEKAECFDRESWRKAGENGLLCASMPEEYGGAGGTFAHESAIIEAVSHVGVDGFGIALHSAIVAPYIHHYGSEEQKQRWLPRLASGEMIGAIAMTEPAAGSDLQGIRTRAVKDGNHYRINGSKTFITNGQLADLIILVAKTDPDKGAKGTSLIVVETDEVEGFERGRNLDKVGLKSNDTSELFFNDVRVPTSNLLGTEEGQGFVQLMEQLPQERLLIGTQAIAMTERALRRHHRLCQGAQGLRQGDPRFPEHAVQARRTARPRPPSAASSTMIAWPGTSWRARPRHRLHGQVLAERPAVQGRRRVPSTAWRLWLHERIPDRPHVARRPRPAHLWRHQRDHEASDCEELVVAEFTLHSFWQSGNSFKAAIMLEICGADWEPKGVAFFAGETRGPAFREANVMGEAPVLIYEPVRDARHFAARAEEYEILAS
jgi:alkylation response protein AidB-like acyl-CoA dehydrogenase